REAFRNKVVGLLLIASPSYGSGTADTLSLVSEFYQQQQARQLQWANPFLTELDAHFKELVDLRTIPDLVGIEALENHFIVHRKWIPDRSVLVDSESGARYFGPPVILRNTDHFGTAKPNDRRHPAHELLSDFLNKNVRDLIMRRADARVLEVTTNILW